MDRYQLERLLRRRAAVLLAAAAIPLAAACSPDDILDVEDPDIINPENIRSASGAEAVRLGALARLNAATSGGESMFLLGGLMADEWSSGDTFEERNTTDQRNVKDSNGNVNTAYRALHRARVAAAQAIVGLEEFGDPDEGWKIGQMYNIQGYIEVMLAEHFCSGIPFSSVEAGVPVYAPGISRDEALERAVGHFDDALAAATGTSAEADTVRWAAQVGKGRALLNLGQYADAATAVAGVPTDFAWFMEHAITTTSNQIWSLNNLVGRWTMADDDGGNGLDFVTADDPRLPRCIGSACKTGGFTSIDKVFDTNANIPFRAQLKWPVRESPVAIISGVEARLIEAEAALAAGSYATPTTGTLAILNDLRADVSMTPLPAELTEDAQEDQLFRERAFWLYSTGHRLGDLRRLVRQYTRPAESVFPTGAYFKGGSYGTDVNFPIPQSEQNNPEFTGCIDRNA
jgi:hypothetical protein